MLSKSSIGCILVLTLCMCNQAFAQKYNWDKAAADERSRSNDAYIEARRKNSPSAGYSSNVKIPTAEEAAAGKKAAADYKAWRQQVDYDAANRQRQREQDQRNYFAKIESDKIAAKERFVSEYLETLKPPKSAFNLLDINIFAQDSYFDKAPNNQKKASKYADYYVKSSQSVRRLVLDTSALLPFDSMITYAYNARLFPVFANRMLDTIRKRFPQKMQNIDRVELLMMNQYFGTITSTAIPESGIFYPKCGFEIMTDVERAKILDRFEELERRFPNDALNVAGYCRWGFNIFYKYATSNLPLKNKTDAKRLEFLYKALTSKSPNRTYSSNIDETSRKLLADKILRPVSEELKLIYPTFVSNLSPEDWQQMADANQMAIEYVAWAFRDADDEKNYLKRLPNLKTARAKEFDLTTTGTANVLLPNGDRYDGALVNGKPQGKGELYKSNGDTYEGTFENGEIKGICTVVYKEARYYNGRQVASENDIYVGEILNGLKHGKGVTTTKNRVNTVVQEGMYKEGLLNGQGTSILNGEQAYNGAYVNGNFHGYGKTKNYEGYWNNGKRSGQGKGTEDNGMVSEGLWEDNYLRQGKLTTKSGYYMMKPYDKKLKKGVIDDFPREAGYFNASGGAISREEFLKHKYD